MVAGGRVHRYLQWAQVCGPSRLRDQVEDLRKQGCQACPRVRVHFRPPCCLPFFVLPAYLHVLISLNLSHRHSLPHHWTYCHLVDGILLSTMCWQFLPWSFACEQLRQLWYSDGRLISQPIGVLQRIFEHDQERSVAQIAIMLTSTEYPDLRNLKRSCHCLNICVCIYIWIIHMYTIYVVCGRWGGAESKAFVIAMYLDFQRFFLVFVEQIKVPLY